MMGNIRSAVYTIGHSNHTFEDFVALLRSCEIDALADVRSVPYSKRHPQYRRESLARDLKALGIAYVFLGEELGARPKDPSCYVGDHVSYERIAATETFESGLCRVEDGANRHRIALMCAEREPLHCHRTLLVSRHLIRRGTPILHIHADGQTETGQAAEERLVEGMGFSSSDLFLDAGARIEEAYRLKTS